MCIGLSGPRISGMISYRTQRFFHHGGIITRQMIEVFYRNDKSNEMRKAIIEPDE